MRFDPNLPPHSVEAEQAVLGGPSGSSLVCRSLCCLWPWLEP